MPGYQLAASISSRINPFPDHFSDNIKFDLMQPLRKVRKHFELIHCSTEVALQQAMLNKCLV